MQLRRAQPGAESRRPQLAAVGLQQEGLTWLRLNNPKIVSSSGYILRPVHPKNRQCRGSAASVPRFPGRVGGLEAVGEFEVAVHQGRGPGLFALLDGSEDLEMLAAAGGDPLRTVGP